MGITFNVVFTPGSPRRLLPFALSLLQGSGARIRLVANGCRAGEAELLRTAAAGEDRISHHVVAPDGPIPHGAALNHLFERFEQPEFAMADSDVLASGDFIPGLLPMAPESAAVFSAPPVWVKEDEAVAPPRELLLGGRHRRLHDGTPVGGAYLAIYRREAIDSVWSQVPRGFDVHQRFLLPRHLRAALSERGWRFRSFDTCRLLNLLLIQSGFRLESRAVPELHHVGGFSGREFEGAAMGLRSLIKLLRSKDDQRPGRIVNGLMRRLNAIARSDRKSRRMRDERRRIVLGYVDSVIDAILAGRQPPPAPQTGAAEVDRRVGDLVSALERHYRPIRSASPSAKGPAVSTEGPE